MQSLQFDSVLSLSTNPRSTHYPRGVVSSRLIGIPQKAQVPVVHWLPYSQSPVQTWGNADDSPTIDSPFSAMSRETSWIRTMTRASVAGGV